MRPIDFSGRVAVVTGAGGGLGRAHATLLAARGAQVVVNDPGGGADGAGGDPGPADAVVAAIRAAGGEATPSYDSVATPEGGEAIVAAALAHYGRLDILVNNAGILRDRSFLKLHPDDLRAVLAVHLEGAFHVTRPAFAQMKAQGYGRLVMTSSGSGLFGNFGQANYGAAKMGLVGLTRVLALEGARYGIRCNAVAPVARTRMTEGLFGEWLDQFEPELVSPLVAWLCHEDCPVSGAIYSAGGGRFARVFVGLTPGWVSRDGRPTPEDVAAHAAQIDAMDDFRTPTEAGEELRWILERLGPN